MKEIQNSSSDGMIKSTPTNKQVESVKQSLACIKNDLNISHWNIGVSAQEPAHGNYMEVVINRLRHYASIRISKEAWNEQNPVMFIEALRHELLHIITDPLVEEYEIQARRLPPELKEEYKERYKAELEKIVEHLSHIY